MNTSALATLLRCLADEKRLRILHLLSEGPLCVCHFQEILGLTQVAASKHLARLRRHGLVASRRHEQWMIYSLPPEPSPELEWQVRGLRELRSRNPVLDADLGKLEARRAECCWVREAAPDVVVAFPRKAARKDSGKKRTTRP